MMPPLSLLPLLRPKPLIKFLVQLSRYMFDSRGVSKPGRRLNDVWLIPITAGALLGVICGDDVDFFSAVETVDLLFGWRGVAAGITVEDAVAAGTH